MKKLVVYSDFVKIISQISDKYDVFFPTNGHFEHSKKVGLTSCDVLNIRTVEPVKLFLFPNKDIFTQPRIVQEQIIVGVKSCDIHAIRVLDKIFLSEPTDENYQTLRKKTIIISADCYIPKQTCFCCIVGNKPYIEDANGVGDVNISFIDENNFILESLTEKGNEFLNRYFSDFDSPQRSDEIRRDSNRTIAVRKILEYNVDFVKEDKKNMYYKTIKSTYEFDNVWEQQSSKCVQCGGCNFICPSCYCFLIREASKSYNEQYRDKVWDVCHFTGYARVAGGANPRKYKYQRFRNRYQCKFVYRYENFGFYACTGCGRCIEVCPAKIDMRKVIRALVLAKGEQMLTQ